MARPGIILVHSRPTAPDFSDSDLASWYNDKHIPDVLATDGVSSAARYQLMCTTFQPDGKPPLPYMAVYYLPDMNWLHQADCEFWKLSLMVDSENAKGRSIFDVAEFEAALWEFVGRRDDGGRGTPSQVILTYLDAEEADGKDAEEILNDSRQGLGDLAADELVRSTLFEVDETCASPPPAKAAVDDNSLDQPGKKRYLCLHEFFNGEINAAFTLAKALQYTLLGESEHGNRQAWEEAVASLDR